MPEINPFALSPGACDGAIHVFEPGWAPRSGFTGTLPHAPLTAYRAIQAELGLDRVMISQASGYGFDNGLLLASLDALGDSGRGTVIIPADIDGQALTDMHRRGARGVRFMMFSGALGWEDMFPVAERVARLGWHFKVQMDGRQIVEFAPLLAALPVAVLLDVYPTTFPTNLDLDGPEITTLLSLVARNNFWVSLTAPNTPEECAEPPLLARRLIAQAPSRCLWSSNWPHLNVSPMPSAQHGLRWHRSARHRPAEPDSSRQSTAPVRLLSPAHPNYSEGPSMMNFDGKLALVMGASGGIGAAVATAFAAQGAHVALHYNRGEAAAQAVADAIMATGGTAVLMQGDISERGVPAKVVHQAAERLGGMDILFNNAGAMIRRMPFMELDDALYEEALDLNARPVIAASQAAVPYMDKRGGGSIINVGSIAGIDGGGSGSGHYGSAKAYVHNLTRHMARDLARLNIRVNAISPGVVQTAFHAATPPERMQAMQATIPLGRLGTPEDCVGPVLFLASSASSYMTGQILHVNGGMYLP